jgi:hypothetical protein
VSVCVIPKTDPRGYSSCLLIKLAVRKMLIFIYNLYRCFCFVAHSRSLACRQFLHNYKFATRGQQLGLPLPLVAQPKRQRNQNLFHRRRVVAYLLPTSVSSSCVVATSVMSEDSRMTSRGRAAVPRVGGRKETGGAVSHAPTRCPRLEPAGLSGRSGGRCPCAPGEVAAAGAGTPP